MYTIKTDKGEQIGVFNGPEEARLYASHYFVIKTIKDYGYLKIFVENISKSKLTSIIQYAIDGACGDLVEAFEVFTRDLNKDIRKQIVEKAEEMFDCESIIKRPIGSNENCRFFIEEIDNGNDLYNFDMDGTTYYY